VAGGGDGGGGNDGVLPPARRWRAAAPLQDFRSSAAAPPDQARPNRRLSCRRRATRFSSAPVVVGGRGNVDGGRSSRRPILDAVGRDRCATAWPSLLGYGDLGGRPVFGGSPVPLFCASMRCGRSPSCGADAAVSDGGGVELRQRRSTRGCGRWCSEAGWSMVCRLCGASLLRVSACGARVWVSSSDCPVLTAERVNPDWVVSCIGGNYLHRRYLAARDRAN